MTTTMFSEGKRLNLDQTDIWKCMVELSVCITGEGNIERTHEELSQILSIPVTSIEEMFMERQMKERQRKYMQNNGAEGKLRRHKSSLVKARTMGKESAKKECHRSSKVPMEESAKAQKPKPPKMCGNCKQQGHTARLCPMPKQKKRTNVEILDWDDIEMKLLSRCAKKPRVGKERVDLLDW